MKHKFFRYFAYTLEMIVLFILERTQNAIPEILGEKPTLVILVVLMIALFEGESAGLIFGLLAGILLDSTINTQLSYLTVLIAIIGYIVGFISRNVISVNFTTAMLVSTASTVLIYMIIFVANYALKPTQAIAKTVMCRQSEIWMIHIERKLKKILQQVCIRPASIKTKMGTIIHILKVVVNGQKS